jgi:hypothetical protein
MRSGSIFALFGSGAGSKSESFSLSNLSNTVNVSDSEEHVFCFPTSPEDFTHYVFATVPVVPLPYLPIPVYCTNIYVFAV